MNSTTNCQAIRTRRAIEQAADYRVSRAVIEGPGAGVSFWVANASKRKIYLVHQGICSCPDYVKRCQDAAGRPNGLKCKHVVLCEEFLGINEIIADEEDFSAEGCSTEELDPEYTEQLAAELQAETDAAMARIRREQNEALRAL